MKKFLLAVAVLLAACSSVETNTPEADCLNLELAQVGDFWGPPAGCERRATVPPNGGFTSIRVTNPEFRAGYFVFYELVWQVGVSGNRATVDLYLLWENPWVDLDPLYSGRVAEIGAHYFTGSTDLVDASTGHSGVLINIRSDASTPAAFTFALKSITPVYAPATQIGAFSKRSGLAVHKILTVAPPPQEPEVVQ